MVKLDFYITMTKEIMYPDEMKKNTVEDYGDKVVIYDDLAENIILYDLDYLPDEAKDGAESFRSGFRIVNRERVHGNPGETYYQGITFIRVIERLSDGKLFGYLYWEDVSKHGSRSVEPNGEKYGFDFEWDEWQDEGYWPSVYVFLPVEPFSITGYHVVEG